MLYIDHKTTPTGTTEQIQQMSSIANTLQIPKMFTKITPPTLVNSLVNECKEWSKLIYPLSITIQTLVNPPINNMERCLPPKVPPQFYYYTDGSFKPLRKKHPKTMKLWHWKIQYLNPIKDLKVVERLPNLRNIIRTEMMAIHHILQILTTKISKRTCPHFHKQPRCPIHTHHTNQTPHPTQ